MIFFTSASEDSMLRHDAAKPLGHRGIAQDLPGHALALFQTLR